jgi:hypothetical protein
VEGGVAATVAPPQSLVKEEDEIPVTAAPLSQPAVNEENENPVADVSLSQSVVKEDKKPPAAAPVSLIVVKKEHNKPVQSAVKEDEKPVASSVPPRSATRENIPKRTLNASSEERPRKKFKSTQETVQNMAPAVPDKKPFELTSRQAVNFLNYLMLQLYPTYYSHLYLMYYERYLSKLTYLI